MGKHIWVNTDHLLEKRITVEGVEIVVQLPRVDAPRTVSGRFDKSDGKFLITFEYLQDEPEASAKTDRNGIAVTEGRYSGKLLSISVPVRTASAAFLTITSKIKKALDERRKRFAGIQTISKELNQDAAEQIFRNECVIKELSEEFAAAN